MSTVLKISLEWYEVELAVHVGARREAELMRQGIDTTKQFSEEPSIENHIESAGAEKAIAKWLNLDWPASINTFAGGVADVGGKIEVRWRRKGYGELKLNPARRKPDGTSTAEDRDDRIYVLVRGAMPNYEVIGWIWGKDAKRTEWWIDPGEKGAYAWFVPDKFLRPPEELKAMVTKIRAEAAA